MTLDQFLAEYEARVRQAPGPDGEPSGRAPKHFKMVATRELQCWRPLPEPIWSETLAHFGVTAHQVFEMAPMPELPSVPG